MLCLTHGCMSVLIQVVGYSYLHLSMVRLCQMSLIMRITSFGGRACIVLFEHLFVCSEHLQCCLIHGCSYVIFFFFWRWWAIPIMS